jgi:hypothetical protein
LARAGLESVTRKKLGPVRYGEEARNLAPPRCVQRRFHQAVAHVVTLPARVGCHGERADFGKVRAVRFKGNAAEDSFLAVAFFDQYKESPDVFANLRFGTREE